MNILTTAMLSMVLLLPAFPGSATPYTEDAQKRVEQHFPKAIETLYKDYRLQGDLLIAVVDADGLRYVYTLNPKGANSEKNGLTVETPFLIASHTKAFTGTLATILQQQEKFDLKASLDHYLSDVILDSRVATDMITIEDLLSHTAGFTSVLHTFKTAFLGYASDAKLIEALNEEMLVVAPGEFRYSNTGPILAAMAMEKATGKKWQELMKQELFEPLEMHNTSSYLSDYPPSEILPSIEVASDGQILRADLYKTDKTLHAAGGTVSTLADMAKWMQFNLEKGKRLNLSPDFFTSLHESIVAQDKRYFTYNRRGYSLAWDIADYHNQTILTRFGGFGGVSFHASFMPSEQLAVIAFFNDERGYVLPHLAANYLYNLVLEPSEAKARYSKELDSFKRSFERESGRAFNREKLALLSKDWQKLLGEYQSDKKWPSIEFFAKGSHVWMRWGDLSGPLVSSPSEQHTYTAALGPLRRIITIKNDSSGSVHIKNGSIFFYRKREKGLPPHKL
ncbi:serine hydrolase [Kangiella sp.]|uniref:serine hydrolase domain-containing protein n=1 Tax=Kangiella sp. TaxID=1920245 RepID=UPI00198FC33F|nr:serine hydrolase [Kangiella sp.]MBD3652706.1 serine hydrolase [Kangiella sp.]